MSSQQPFNTGSMGSSSTNPSHHGSLNGSMALGLNTAANAAALSEVLHIQHLSEDIGALYLDDQYSDVVLVVAGHRFHAHRVILAARSAYFRALLYGGMRESSQPEIELKDTPLAAFKYLMRYIYTGQMSLAELKDDLVLEILGLAHQYGFQELETAISDYLRAALSIRNVCLIYDTAALYQLESLISSCCIFMDKHATEIIGHEAFLSLSAVSAIVTHNGQFKVGFLAVRSQRHHLPRLLLRPRSGDLSSRPRLDQGQPRRGGHAVQHLVCGQADAYVY